jgi:hypothetical protein
MLHYPEADELYREILEIDPRFVPAMFNLAVLRSESNDNDKVTEADELYRGVLDIDPVNVKAMHNLDVLQQQKWNLLLKLKIY